MEFILITLLNGLSYGLLLFMLSSGLTLIYSMMGVLNMAHASFYMIGAYFAYAVSVKAGFWLALFIAPLLAGVLGAMVERFGLRLVYKHGRVAELLFTFGLSLVMVEVVQLVWGRAAVPYAIPPELEGPLFTFYSTNIPRYRGFMMLVACVMLLSLYVILMRTRVGLVIRAALTHPAMVEALGHNVPRVFMLVFGAGCALAALAGVVGGNAFVTEPGMAATVGSIVFVVVVVGGVGSLAGALLASLLIGILQTLAVALDYSALTLLHRFGATVDAGSVYYPLVELPLSRVAPMLPYVLLILTLIFRPYGLLGTREH